MFESRVPSSAAGWSAAGSATTLLLGGVVFVLVVIESVLLLDSGDWDVTQLLLWGRRSSCIARAGLVQNLNRDA